MPYKRLTLVAAMDAVAAIGSVAQAQTDKKFDPYTQGAKSKDPYTDGAKK